MKAFFLASTLAATGLLNADAQQNAAPAAPTFGIPHQQTARNTAERVYNTWRLGMIRANESAWRSATSQSRQAKVRNMIISQKGTFPRDFFDNQPEPPKLENFRFVGALTGCNNHSLAVTYVGLMQLGTGKAEPNAYVLEFIFENGKWHFDQSRFFNLSQLPDVRKRLEAGDISILKEQDGFAPYTALPQVPPLCPAPQLIGKVFADAPGRSIQMCINGISLHEFSDERRADVISGGLRRGKNTISYTISTDAAKSHPSMAIGLFVMPETPGNKPICVFDHILDAADAAKGGSFTFDISNEQIASMAPTFTGTAPAPFHAVPLKQKPQGK